MQVVEAVTSADLIKGRKRQIHQNSNMICTRLINMNVSSSMVGNMTQLVFLNNTCINVNLQTGLPGTRTILECFLACGTDSSEIKDHTICTDCKKNI